MCNLFSSIAANKLNSDVVHFPAYKSNVSCKKSDCCRLRNVFAEVREVVLLFATKLVRVMHFTGPSQTCFAADDITPGYGKLLHEIFINYLIRSQYSHNLPQHDLLQDSFEHGW